MKNHVPIYEIFEVINTAHLSSLCRGSKEPAADLRKWLVDNRNNMSPECATFLNELGVTKKGFAMSLKKWFSQYHHRQSFVRAHDGKDDIDWLKSFGGQWQEMGGVFYFQSEGEKCFDDQEVRQAHKVGVISVVEKDSDSGCKFVLEALVAGKAKLNAILSLLDKCGIPIADIAADKSQTIVSITITSPGESEFNRVVKEAELPQYASQLLKKQRRS